MSVTWAVTGERRLHGYGARLTATRDTRLATPDVAALAPHAVHLWVARLGDFVKHCDELMTLLSEPERARAARYRFAEPQQRFIIGRWALRMVLGHYLDEPAAALAIDVSSHGKPCLAGPSGGVLRFSISHSGDLIAIAVVAGCEVGVDVEVVGQGADVPTAMTTMMRRLYSEAELRWLDSHPPASVGEAILSLWTCKEAYGKALGTGLRPPILTLDDVLGEHSPVTDLPWAWVYRDGERAWAVRRLAGLDGFVGALLVERPTGAPSAVELRQYVLRPR